jgi:hypothetical protein
MRPSFGEVFFPNDTGVWGGLIRGTTWCIKFIVGAHTHRFVSGIFTSRNGLASPRSIFCRRRDRGWPGTPKKHASYIISLYVADYHHLCWYHHDQLQHIMFSSMADPHRDEGEDAPILEIGA